jgi:hypothetical protein
MYSAHAAATTVLVDEKMAKKFRPSGNAGGFNLSVTHFGLAAILTFAVELPYSLLTIIEEEHGSAIEVLGDDREE